MYQTFWKWKIKWKRLIFIYIKLHLDSSVSLHFPLIQNPPIFLEYSKSPLLQNLSTSIISALISNLHFQLLPFSKIFIFLNWNSHYLNIMLVLKIQQGQSRVIHIKFLQFQLMIPLLFSYFMIYSTFPCSALEPPMPNSAQGLFLHCCLGSPSMVLA